MGHIATALAAKGVSERAPFALFVAAAYGPDLLELVLEVAGVRDRLDLWSHTIPAVVVLAALFGFGALIARTERQVAALAALLVLLHLPMDLLTGRQILWPGGSEAGIGLYRIPWLNFALEVSMLVAGGVLYRRSLARSRGAAAVVMVVGLALFQLAFTRWWHLLREVSIVIHGYLNGR